MGTYIAGVSPMEAGLMVRVRNRDESAFQELVEKFQKKIYRTAIRILREEHSAEDALQETLVNVYRAAHKFRGDSRIGTWVNRITVNVCLEMIRKNKRHADRAEEDVSELGHLGDPRQRNPFEQYRRNEIREKVWGALGKLGRKHRKVVALHDIEGYTIKEIASILEVPEGTVKSRLFYGREDLKRRLAA